MPPLTAALYDDFLVPLGFPRDTLEQLSTQCLLTSAKRKDISSYPLLVFSHGGGSSGVFYTTILEDLARRGFAVAAVDHPHDSLIVEFPNGETIIGLNKSLTRQELETLNQIRAEDLSFVIDELPQLLGSSASTPNNVSVVAFGRSLGGGSVADAMLNDTCIKGGINVDGILFGSMEEPNTTLSKPFLQITSEESTKNLYWR